VHGGDALGDIGVPPPAGAPQDRHAVYELVERVMARSKLGLTARGSSR